MKKIIISLITFVLLMTIVVGVNKQNTPLALNTYSPKDSELRAAWVSYYTGDIKYSNENQYKESIDNILDTLEYFNLNAIIFHVRANNDAWYKSSLNPVNSQLARVNFDQFDPLEYVITEAHKRGIEFHAWLNPYRIGSTYSTKEAAANAFKSTPNNPASNPDNILIGSPLQILDPGLPEVRDFLVDTCLELVENYEVDAIHFDDYFYANGIDDSATVQKYNTKGLSVADFRRAQVDEFIYQLKNALDEFNQTSDRFVQLGIAPTGVYRNASSKAEAQTPLDQYVFNSDGDLTYPKGATTGCQEHYASYLYCDTLKWVNNEWINYICPQTYWAQSHSLAPFEPLINWWNQAVKNKNVNLYAAMGIYMWTNLTNEPLEQVTITSNLENVKGTSIYSYKQVSAAYTGTDPNLQTSLGKVKQQAWQNKAILPEVAGTEPRNIGSVQGFIQNGNTISFQGLKGAKFYIIYRDVDSNYSNDKIVDIFHSDEEIVTWTDPDSGMHTYDVIPLSYTNTLGSPTNKVAQYVPGNIPVLVSIDNANPLPKAEVYNVTKENQVSLNIDGYNLTDFNWTTNNNNVVSVNTNGNLTINGLGSAVIVGTLKIDQEKIAKVTFNVYEGSTNTKQFNVKFVNFDGSIIKEEKVTYGSSATPPTNVTMPSTQEFYYEFIGWNKLYYNITSDVTIMALFESKYQKYHVTWQNANGDILKEEDVEYGHPATPPTNPTLDETTKYQYYFKNWDQDYSRITEDTIIKAEYNQTDRSYQVTFELNNGSKPVVGYYFWYEEIIPPVIKDSDEIVFVGWYFDSNFTNKCELPYCPEADVTLYAKYAKYYYVEFYNYNDDLVETKKVLEGDSVTPPTLPEIPGFKFEGWNENLDHITKNLIVKPIYSQIPDDNKCSCQKDALIMIIITSFSALTSLFLLRKKH